MCLQVRKIFVESVPAFEKFLKRLSLVTLIERKVTEAEFFFITSFVGGGENLDQVRAEDLVMAGGRRILLLAPRIEEGSKLASFVQSHAPWVDLGL